MKKYLKICSILLVVLLLTGCSLPFNLKSIKKNVENVIEEELEDEKEEKKSNKKEKGVCYRHVEDYTESYTMYALGNDIYEVDFTMKYDKDNDLADFSTYTDAQKEAFKQAMLTNLGITGDEEGIDVTVTITDTLEVEIDADLEKADPDKLESLGFYFDEVNNELDSAVKSFKTSGYICS